MVRALPSARRRRPDDLRRVKHRSKLGKLGKLRRNRGGDLALLARKHFHAEQRRKREQTKFAEEHKTTAAPVATNEK